jgi:hypothetical protein
MREREKKERKKMENENEKKRVPGFSGSFVENSFCKNNYIGNKKTIL